MSDTSFGFGKFVPGFDFLQNLAKGATQTIPQLPNLSNWIAPTLSVEELDKRIGELKAVHFWLDQNGKALGATIQALEVQKMTLATLKGMNFSMGDVANALKLKAADASMFGATPPPKMPEAQTEPEPEPEPEAKAKAGVKRKPTAKAAAKAMGGAAEVGGVVDPLQWWGALTQQFQEIASTAMKDAAQKTAMDTAKNVATGVAKEAMKAGMDMARAATGTGAAVARKAVGSRAGKAKKPPARKSRSG
ncbi:PhaM family polyhydroxyalkanoate granule multifunctional regulatory protein [Ramlibacter sp.]|uniref:PhaM family polyhydroxyalkanoate granule multifunctional regulatory protein n=1 Tax=Ramlibacter sp. TaxID=1917967 RepID=UPI003D09B818